MQSSGARLLGGRQWQLIESIVACFCLRTLRLVCVSLCIRERERYTPQKKRERERRRQTDRPTDGRTDGQTDRRTDGQTDRRWTDGQTQIFSLAKPDHFSVPSLIQAVVNLEGLTEQPRSRNPSRRFYALLNPQRHVPNQTSKRKRTCSCRTGASGQATER